MVLHVDIIGYFAACLTTFSFLVQALKSWRTRDLSGISVGMYAMFTAGVALWLVYGIVIDSMPLIITNALTFLFACSVLLMKLKQMPK
jgi:MtN3 and saliva related transmembrane protein